MFVVTADQIDSRHHSDAVAPTLAALEVRFGTPFVRSPQRTAGDEFQCVVDDPALVLDLVLFLTRDGGWSVGVGIGPVDRPLPDDARAGSGPAFLAARLAVDAAKKSVTRCAVRVVPGPLPNKPPSDSAGDASGTGEVGPLLDLLLALRARRSSEGWEVFDLAADGITQKAMAARLTITEQAVSARVRAADVRLEEAAVPELRQLFRLTDRATNVSTARGTDKMTDREKTRQ